MTAGERLRLLHRELAGAFNLDELDRLAVLHLGIGLEQVAGEGCTPEEAALALVRWARRQGGSTLGTLTAAAAAERPHNATLQELTQPEPPAAVRKAPGSAWKPMDNFDEYSGNGVQRQLGKLSADVAHMQGDMQRMSAEVTGLRADVQRALQREPWAPGMWYMAVFVLLAATAVGVAILAFQ